MAILWQFKHFPAETLTDLQYYFPQISALLKYKDIYEFFFLLVLLIPQDNATRAKVS